MGYLIETLPQADADLDALNASIRGAVVRRLLEFAKSPGSAQTAAARPPYPTGQLLQFTFTFEGETCWAGVVYQYSQDETHLIVHRVFVEMM